VTHLVRLELRNLLAERASRIALALLLFGCVIALLVGLARASSDRELSAELARDHAHELDRLGAAIDRSPEKLETFFDARQPAFVAEMSDMVVADLHRGTLAPLAVGQRDVWPTAMRLGLPGSIMRELYDERLDRIENPRHGATGPFDLTFVIVFFVPLVIVALGHDLVSADRERGTAFLLQADNVSLVRIVAARLLARFVVVAVPLAAIAIAGWVVGGADLSGATLGRLGLWLGIALAYTAFWLALCALIQTLRRSSTTNAVIGAAAWLFFALVWPVAAQLLARAFAPLPSRPEYALAKRDAKEAADRTADADIAAWYAAHPELSAHTREMSEGMSFPRWFVPMLKARQSVAHLRARLESELDHEEAVAGALASISPSLACFEALPEAAGQGASRHRRFRRQAEAFDEHYADAALERSLRLERLSKADLGGLPQFAFAEESPVAAWSRLGLLLAKLIVPTLLVSGLAWSRLRKSSWITT
jgi:ABC-2 type transport system permease protein